MRRIYLLAMCLLCACSSSKSRLLDLEAKKELEMICRQITGRHPVELITNSFGHIADDNQARFGIGFISRNFYTLEQARSMILDIAKTFNIVLESRPIFTEVMAESILSKKAIAIKIAFWDSNMERPLYPYLAQIQVRQGRIYYYYANPHTGALQAPITEDIPWK